MPTGGASGVGVVVTRPARGILAGGKVRVDVCVSLQAPEQRRWALETGTFLCAGSASEIVATCCAGTSPRGTKRRRTFAGSRGGMV